ncbi:hypothetical protein SDJN02_21175, partial [Cucurbita argyrosperma subsp. argyrosperma]
MTKSRLRKNVSDSIWLWILVREKFAAQNGGKRFDLGQGSLQKSGRERMLCMTSGLFLTLFLVLHHDIGYVLELDFELIAASFVSDYLK